MEEEEAVTPVRNSRRYYEARVVVVPLGSSARRAVDDMQREGLGGIACLERPVTGNAHADGYRLDSLGPGWAAGRPGPTSLAGALDDADVVVFVAAELAEVDHGLSAAVERTARAAGALVAAVTIGTADDGEASRRGLADLRERVDMLLNVRSVRFAAAFLDVVRGGRRDPAAQALT